MKYYEVYLYPVVNCKHSVVDIVGEVKFKTITQVARFVDTIDKDYLTCQIISPKLNFIDPDELLRIWRS